MMRPFYWAMMRTYHRVFGAQQMLHYPMFLAPGQSLLEGQRAFSDLVVSSIGGISGADTLEIGCGNGEQALYLAQTHAPRSFRGIDLYPRHIQHAAREARQRGIEVGFAEDDAELLATVAAHSVDAVLCVESAHHYPHKDRFLAQLRRVLRPGGRFTIAEIISLSGANNFAYRLSDTLCWTQEQWETGFARAGLSLERTSDVTATLVRGLVQAERDIVPGGSLGARVAKAFGRQVLRHYLRELAGDRRYVILTGSNPALGAP